MECSNGTAMAIYHHVEFPLALDQAHTQAKQSCYFTDSYTLQTDELDRNINMPGFEPSSSR